MPQRLASIGKSIFSGLQPDVKRSIRAQTIQPYPSPTPTSVQVKAELINSLISDVPLLPTQPFASSSKSVSPLSDAESETSDGFPGPAAEVVLKPLVANGSRPDVAVEQVAANTIQCSSDKPGISSQIETATPAGPARKRPTPISPIASANSGGSKPRKRRKEQHTTLYNAHADHPWDCSHLVTRYDHYSEVPQELTKYFAQRHLYFPRYDELPLLLDDTGWFSITPYQIATHIAQRCRCDVVVDAFCGVGGNAIAFAKTCERVIAIDIDVTRLRLARHNALQHGVADRIEFIHADFLEYAQSFKADQRGRKGKGLQDETIDVVFLSPPWGGPEYMTFADPSIPSSSQQSYPLSAIEPISGQELFDLSSALSPNIAFYLPRNVNIGEVSQLARRMERPEVDRHGQKREREWVEVEEAWVGDKLKAVTAYFGGLVASE